MTQITFEMQYNDTAVLISADADSPTSVDRLEKAWGKVEEALGPADALIIYSMGREWKATRRDAIKANVEYSGTA